jgi:hypothetical protein
MADAPSEKRRALAARLRELRTEGFRNRPLNRKEVGKLLGEAMNRPAGPYAARRVGDFENPEAKSPPPLDALRGYAQIFGNGSAELLEDELLALRRGIDGPPPGPDGVADGDGDGEPTAGRRRAVVAVTVAVGLAVIVAAFFLGRADKPAEATFCPRDTEIRPAAGGLATVCARDVRLRPSPSAPSDQALGTVRSGDTFTVDRYSSTGSWVHGIAHLESGDVEGWIEGGWFCPPAGTGSPATACDEP